jgi:hypothetical protein
VVCSLIVSPGYPERDLWMPKDKNLHALLISTQKTVIVEGRKIFPLPGFEFRTLGRPAHSQYPYRLRYIGRNKRKKIYFDLQAVWGSFSCDRGLKRLRGCQQVLCCETGVSALCSNSTVWYLTFVYDSVRLYPFSDVRWAVVAYNLVAKGPALSVVWTRDLLMTADNTSSRFAHRIPSHDMIHGPDLRRICRKILGWW